MGEQLEVLIEYYTNLDYDKNDKETALKEIHELSEKRFNTDISISARLDVLANLIQENISPFKSVCRHVDVIDTIVGYIKFYGQEMRYVNGDRLKDTLRIIFPLLVTLFNICDESAIQSFLLYPIFTDSPIDFDKACKKIKYWQSSVGIEREMIVLEDSDMYAVINCLIITDKCFLHKIWVQEQVKEKFVWLMKRHYSDITACEEMLLIIDTFQLFEDIQLHECAMTDINIVSIWSEDIVAAKNLALSLNCHAVFINTHMDFSDGCHTFLPYKKIVEYVKSQRTLNEIREKESVSSETEQSVNVVHLSHIADINFTSIFNLFYDGTWQEPVKGMYWKHNDNFWANATNDDIIRCYESAEKGFKTWSIKSVKTRIQILSKLEPMLKLNGKLALAAIVTRWLKFLYLCPINGYIYQNGKAEMTDVRKPLGIIILREEKESVLLFRLMQTLIAGNSVIVMFDANFCNLTPYCDMFSTCGIPPGVINLLSHEDANMLEYKLCSAEYTDYADRYFLKGTSKDAYVGPYLNLTTTKYIIVRLK
ncbi:uncharacterized protein LOC143899346 [Temnothorax americanus]|uniref:uncharacterized protein LOC143899346 n=1 Tax=Temnothorax americanus TaxID=1964332 RepID=UPI004069193F